MTEESRQIGADMFRSWVLEQKSPDYKLYIKENDQSTIVLENDCGRAEVTFFAQDIIQLSVLDFKSDRHVFYLHFQMHTLEHACSLFEEMRDTLLELGSKPSAKILLCCVSGLTTAYFAEKLNEAAALLSLDYEFNAESYSELYQAGNRYDLILLAPQIYYAYDDIKKILPDQTILKIPAKIFASYDVSGLLEEITPYITGQTRKAAEGAPGSRLERTQSLPLKQDLTIDVCVLAIAMINDLGKVQYAYRIYSDSGKILFENDVVKPRFTIYDIYDICGTALTLFPEIEVIGLSIPRMDEALFSQDSETPEASDAEDTLATANPAAGIPGIKEELGKRFGRKVIVENAANTIAAGYYASQDKYSSLSVLFQPYIGSVGNVGSIQNGHLITGLRHVAGEVKYLPMYSHPQDGDKVLLRKTEHGDPGIKEAECPPALLKWKTPEGALQLATGIMATIIALMGPELIVLSSNLLIHADTIAAGLEEYIPKEYIPDLVLLYNIREYMLLGTALCCAGTPVS